MTQPGPYRIMPARVRAAFEVLDHTLAVRNGCGREWAQRELDQEEKLTNQAAHRCLRDYLTGERDFADVVQYIYPVPQSIMEEMMAGEIVEVQASEERDETVGEEMGE